MEHHHFSWENPLEIAIFNSYVSLPEGTISTAFLKNLRKTMEVFQKSGYSDALPLVFSKPSSGTSHSDELLSTSAEMVFLGSWKPSKIAWFLWLDPP